MALDPKMEAALRASARSLLGELDRVVQQLGPSFDLDERLEIGAPIAELRRLLHSDAAPPAHVTAAPNVRVVAFGKTGPKFGAGAGVEFAVGARGLRSGALEVPRAAADEFARANDLPAEGSEQLQNGEN